MDGSDDISGSEEVGYLDVDALQFSDDSVFGNNQINKVIVDDDLILENLSSDDDCSSDRSTSTTEEKVSRFSQGFFAQRNGTSQIFSSPLLTLHGKESSKKFGYESKSNAQDTPFHNSVHGVKNLSNAAFSSALLDYCFKTYEAPTKRNTYTGSSRYEKALQLLRHEKSQDEDSTEKIKGNTDLMMNGSLYDGLSSVLLQECDNAELDMDSDVEDLKQGDTVGLPSIVNNKVEHSDTVSFTDIFTTDGVKSFHSDPKEMFVNNPIGPRATKVKEKIFEENYMEAETINLNSVYRDIDTSCNIHSSTGFKKFIDQTNIFLSRLKVSNHLYIQLNSKPHDKLYSLIFHVETLVSSTHPTELLTKMSMLTSNLKEDRTLASLFLANFVLYLQSVIDLESNLYSLDLFLVCFLPCVLSVVNKTLESKLVEEIMQDRLLPQLYGIIRKTIVEETKYCSDSIYDIIKWKPKSTVKAHVVRLQPTESQILFQETFQDTGKLPDLYVIYVWRILKLYEIAEVPEIDDSSVKCFSDAMVRSGQYISTIPMKEVNERETKAQFIQMREAFPMSSEDPLETQSNFAFEWIDFRVGQFYDNGVVFITNMTNWMERLKEISLSIDKLEVKKSVKFLPALGSTYGLHLEDGLRVLNRMEDIRYIRVRVIRVAGPVVRVYGIDSGSVVATDVADLILLPAPLITISPLGRLAQLPVVPAPRVEAVLPTLNILRALTYHKRLAGELRTVDIRPLMLLMQIPKLTYSVLQLLKHLQEVSLATPLMQEICILISDYLVRAAHYKMEKNSCVSKSLSILISAMEASPDIRILLAKEGAFVTLCELGLRVGGREVWNMLRVLLGGKDAMASWLSVSNKISRVHEKQKFIPRRFQERHIASNIHSKDSSVAIISIAAMSSLDQNWDLEVRNTISSRQLVSYFEPSGWSWTKQEVLTANTNELHYGHKFNVQNDETHHIILDKSIPNIRMNTLLQIILGMLNTGLGGKIYIGLSSLGVVQGVRITRDQRDCFMLGFSMVVTSEIFPMMLPCDSVIQFIPVIRSGMSSSYLQTASSESLYVMILTVRPQPNQLYRYRCDPEPILMREAGVTTTLRGNTLMQMNNSLASKTRQLQEVVSSEKQALLKQIFLKGDCGNSTMLTDPCLKDHKGK